MFNKALFTRFPACLFTSGHICYYATSYWLRFDVTDIGLWKFASVFHPEDPFNVSISRDNKR